MDIYPANHALFAHTTQLENGLQPSSFGSQQGIVPFEDLLFSLPVALSQSEELVIALPMIRMNDIPNLNTNNR
jgi:hypothetical protein